MNSQRPARLPALFVHYEGTLRDSGGGVQICTQEYGATLRAAGFHLRYVEIKNDRRPLTRIRRRLSPRPYANAFIPDEVARNMADALDENLHYIFINQAVLRPLGKLIRKRLAGDYEVVLLSHGLQSVDFLHQLRSESSPAFENTTKAEMIMLARQLIEETRQSRYLDHIFCLAPFEVGIERWLGGKAVTYLPRTITRPPLLWQPIYGRMGYVGRLDHPPNKEGLISFLTALEQLASDTVRLRLVGSPRRAGQAIAKRFAFVDYLGRLTDEQLRSEACSWNCFVHPVFCYAMGASTKLAVAIGWQIPVVTTSMGRRGYIWREGHMPIADTPQSLAKLALELTDPKEAQQVQLEISKIRKSSPTKTDIASRIRSALSL